MTQLKPKKSSQSCNLNKKNIFSIKLLHANVHGACIVKTKCQVDPSKAVVGVDQPMYSMHYHSTSITAIKYKPEKVLIAVILSILICLKTNSFMYMFNVSTLCRQSVKLIHQKAVVGVDQPVYALS